MTDFSQQYFTIESLEDSNTITFTIGSSVTSSQMTSISYSTDGGTTWTTTNVNSTTQTINVSLNTGGKVLWKGIGSALANNYEINGAQYRSTFSSTKNYIVYGNIMSMLYGDSFSDKTSVTGTYAFCGLFYQSTKLVDAKDLIIPIKTVDKLRTFVGTFRGCTNMLNTPQFAPEAITQQHACMRMFLDCTSITSTNDLSKLTTITGASACMEMFRGCTSLVNVSDLPATTLYEYCYNGMFKQCTVLKKAPKLPAQTLANYCYREMFYECSSLEEITCLATNISATNCLTNWVYNVASGGIFYKDASMSSWTTGASGIPSGWTISDYYDDYSQQYFTVQSAEDSNVLTLTIGENVSTTDLQSVSYSVDNGANWITTQVVNSTTQTINVAINRGDKILWKGSGIRLAVDTTQSDNNSQTVISSTKTFNAYGNIMSLLYGDNFAGQTTLTGTCTFDKLFYSSSVVDASNLVLPATTLVNSCYYEMFRGCTSLVSAPDLHALVVPGNSYKNMFHSCSSLTKAPVIYATSLGNYACQYMFLGCSSLVNFQNSLYTTSVGQLTCSWMFQDCTSLAKAPELPATTLGSECYRAMFLRCTSLTKSPVLQVATLVNGCYRQMFNGCTNLQEVTCLATNISASNCLTDWVYGVAATGTFYKHPSMTGWGTGNSGIPSRWTTKDYMMLTVNGNIPAAVKFVQNGVTHDLDYLKFGNNLVWQKTT